MTCAEMIALYEEDCNIYFRTLSIFYQKRAKLLESAILDAIKNRHSDAAGLKFESRFTNKITDYEQTRTLKPDHQHTLFGDEQ